MKLKKLLLTLLVILASCTASKAELYLGGGLGFGGSSNGQFRLYIAPEIGYNFTDHFTVGGKVSYETGVNRFGIDPYVRLNILKRESVVRILAAVEAPFEWASSYSSCGVCFRPGLSVRIAPNVRIEGLFGYFGWSSVTRDGAITSQGWTYAFNSSAISIGVIVGL